MNLTLQIVLTFIGVITGVSVVTTCVFLIRESRTAYKQMTVPKPATITGKIPEYLDYEKCFKQLSNHLSIQFQRIYTTLVLPNLRDSNGRVNRLAPTDKRYEEIVTMMVLQSIQQMPYYLKKSVYFYFNVSDDGNEEQIAPMIEYISSAMKGKLDAHIITIAERIENDRADAAGGIVLHRDLQKVRQTGKRHDLIKPGADEFTGIAHDRSVEKDVFPRCQIEVKARAELDHGADRPSDRHAAAAGLIHTRHQLQQCGFARAVSAHKSDHLAFAHSEGQVTQRPEFAVSRRAPAAPRIEQLHKALLEGKALFDAEVEAHGKPLGTDHIGSRRAHLLQA